MVDHVRHALVRLPNYSHPPILVIRFTIRHSMRQSVSVDGQPYGGLVIAAACRVHVDTMIHASAVPMPLTH